MFPIAPGSNVLFPTLACTNDPAWAIIRKDEAAADATDRFSKQSCSLFDGLVSLFLPSTLDARNRVHVFFSAGHVDGDYLNSVVAHGFRAAAEDAGWILIAVKGPIFGPEYPISAAQIREILALHGRGMGIDSLRLSSHSRGAFNLVASLPLLVSDSPFGPEVPRSTLERIVSFDSEASPTSLRGAADNAGISLGIVFGFWATSNNWSLPIERTIHLGQGGPVTTTPYPKRDAVAKGLRAVEYLRLLDDIAVTRPDVTIPQSISDARARLPIPARGAFTSRVSVAEQVASTGVLGPASSPLVQAGEMLGTGPVNFQIFCHNYAATIESLVGAEVDGLGNTEIFDFIKQNDLVRTGDPTIYDPGRLHHHLLVAEFAHEVTDEAEPQPA